MNLRLPLLLTVLALAGCAHSDTKETLDTDIQGLPQPTQVYVSRFSFTASDVTPNQAITARMNNKYNDVSPQTVEEEVGMSVASTMQSSLINSLNGYGIPAVATQGGVPPVGSFVIEGELLTIKEGNSFQRFAVGLGAGQSKVVSYVSTYLVTSTGLVNVAQFYSDSKSSVKPGVATMLIIPAAAGGSLATTAAVSGGVGVATAKRQTAQADAARTAKKIAAKVNQLFMAEGWN